jgi:hypothetical protein
MTQQEQFRDPAEIRHTIGAAGSFSLSNISGDIRIRGTDGDEAVVLARGGHRDAEFLPMMVRRAEGALHIEVDQKQFSGFMGWLGRGRDDIEFDITLPRGARVDVNAVGSDIEVMEMVGQQSYKSVSGDVTLESTGGRISLTTVSGDVELRADDPVEADVTSTSGDIELGGPSFRATRLRTVSGDIEIRGAFETGEMHTIETVSGDVAIESTSGLTVEVRKGIDLGGEPKQRIVGDGAARLRFRSLSGDLHLEGARGAKARKVPEGFAFSVKPAPPAESAPDSLEILRALERGEIDIEEAQRRLEGATSNA